MATRTNHAPPAGNARVARRLGPGALSLVVVNSRAPIFFLRSRNIAKIVQNLRNLVRSGAITGSEHRVTTALRSVVTRFCRSVRGPGRDGNLDIHLAESPNTCGLVLAQYSKDLYGRNGGFDAMICLKFLSRSKTPTPMLDALTRQTGP